MTRFPAFRTALGGFVTALIVALAGCAAPPPPQPVAPPIVRIPPRPRPPLNAAENLTIPPRAPDGSRPTVNSNLSTAQMVWNLRSAYNVAALNCLDPQYAPILAGYGQFLKVQSKTLAAVNKDLDKAFKANYGSKIYIRERETYQTQVYNYFALPPVLPSFCNAALQVSNELQAVPAGQLEAYATNGLDKVDSPFRDFFNNYDQYRVDVQAWDARYGVPAPMTVAAPGAAPAPVQAASAPEGS